MIPQDPMMLLSYINMKLRNDYTSLSDLCLSENIDMLELLKKMAQNGFEYSDELIKFW